MAYKVNFIEVEPEKPCCYCGRKKLNKSEKFFKVFIGDRDFGMVVCEFCKGSYSTHIFEGSERTYATHLTFYVKRSLFELKEKLPEMMHACMQIKNTTRKQPVYNRKEMITMRTEKEIRERLEKLTKERLTEGPYIEKDSIAWHATKQALEWVLEETETLLTY
jgi:hypothetical protein